MNNLFTGNIMQRTCYEKEITGAMSFNSEIHCFMLRENAILYQTDNGGYVDINDLQGISDYDNVNKVIIEDDEKTTSDGISVMPAVALSKIELETASHGRDGTLGRFVDSESLQPCQQKPQHEENVQVKRR